MLTEEQIELQRIILSYLAFKLGIGPEWFNTEQEFLFGEKPCDIVNRGEGAHIIRWMEERLGLRPGAAF